MHALTPIIFPSSSDRSRFQLFGDTVNTAARMESTGVPGKIHISSTTAQLLRDSSKQHWVKARPDPVVAKGKGTLVTFFLSLGSRSDTSETSGSDGEVPSLKPYALTTEPPRDSDREERLIDWIVDQLAMRMKMVIARHDALGIVAEPGQDLIYTLPEGKTSLDEVVDVIPMPDFDCKTATLCSANVVIDSEAMKQLHKLVSTIASYYKNNPFHNFEHACHVTMNVSKLLNRIVAPDMDEDLENAETEGEVLAHLHDFSHGLTSDHVTLFAIVFSALIHDADHRGVSNSQLANEEGDLATKYCNKSIAEQRSVDVCWDLLMQDEYDALRRTMFRTRKEMMRFRQVLVNTVLATDIFDSESNGLRRMRWDRAFNKDTEDSDLRATIIIEHIIQASDVSHTMQHWHIYRKWNERLFLELHAAYKAGRMAKDPSTFWYNGEIGFFDNYVIPLARKLDQCGVFGVSSDECLNYAVQNRDEWQQKGQEVVASLMAKVGKNASESS